MIQQLPINLWLFFWFKHYQKCNFLWIFSPFFILKVYLSFQVCCSVISAPQNCSAVASAATLVNGRVSIKATRGCRRLRWRCGSPAAANWIHSSLLPSLLPPLCTEREELPCLTGAEGGSIQKALSPFSALSQRDKEKPERCHLSFDTMTVERRGRQRSLRALLFFSFPPPYRLNRTPPPPAPLALSMLTIVAH